jgi:hypothetical protein
VASAGVGSGALGNSRAVSSWIGTLEDEGALSASGRALGGLAQDATFEPLVLTIQAELPPIVVMNGPIFLLVFILSSAFLIGNHLTHTDT